MNSTASLEGIRFFARSPFGSRGFLASSILLFLDLCTCAIFLVRHGRALPGATIAYLVLGTVFLVILWYGTLRMHGAIFRLLRDNPQPESKALLSVPLSLFANWIYYGLCSSYIAAGCLYGAFVEFFIKTNS
jgi:membrane-bound metal-dependent hydrolase YbcI (DUF457 family)